MDSDWFKTDCVETAAVSTLDGSGLLGKQHRCLVFT